MSVIISSSFLTEGLFSAVKTSWQNPWSETIKCVLTAVSVHVSLKWRSDGQCVTCPVNLLDSITHMHTDHPARPTSGQERKLHQCIFYFILFFCMANVNQSSLILNHPSSQTEKPPESCLSEAIFQPAPPFGDSWDATLERTDSPASCPSMLSLLMGFGFGRDERQEAIKRKKELGEEIHRDGKGGGRGERMDGLDGGGNGRVFEGGLCVSFIPRVPTTCPNMEAFAIARGLFSRPTADQWEKQRIVEGGHRKEGTAVGESLIKKTEWKYEDKIEIKQTFKHFLAPQ